MRLLLLFCCKNSINANAQPVLNSEIHSGFLSAIILAAYRRYDQVLKWPGPLFNPGGFEDDLKTNSSQIIH